MSTISPPRIGTDIGYWYIQGQQAQRAVDATPNDNSDFLTGPLPQIEVTSPRSGALEVKVRNEGRSFLGKIVLDSILVERFAVSEIVPPLHLGNPSSALGTGTIPGPALGVPPDLTWLSLALDWLPMFPLNDHMLEITIEIPTNYTCSGNCSWTVRYTTDGGVGDRTNWSIDIVGDPVQLVE